MKDFSAAETYREEIRVLLSGYEKMHAALETALIAARPQRVCVVGCGPGDAIRTWAQMLPEAQFDAIDPEPGMTQAARVTLAPLGPRGTVFTRDAVAHAAAQQGPPMYDVVVCALVSHFIPHEARDGASSARMAHVQAMADLLRPGGVLLHAVLGRAQTPEADAAAVAQAVSDAAHAGLPVERQSGMTHKLGHVFARLTDAEEEVLFERAGLCAGPMWSAHGLLRGTRWYAPGAA